MSTIVEPHGGTLVDRIVPAAELTAFRELAEQLPAVELDARELADLELIATGAASPLQGFMGSADYLAVLEHSRLASGLVWPLPITLAVTESVARDPGEHRVLRDRAGRVWGILHVDDVFETDPQSEAEAVYRTTDPSHPGVAYLLGRPRWILGGRVRVAPLPEDLPFARYRLTPRALRAEIQARGWTRVAGFQTRNPIHRAHEHLTKIALEMTDGLVIHPLIGETKHDDVPPEVRFRAYEVLIDRYYPRDRTLLAAFPAAMRYAGPREALFHVLVRKNYGITDLIVGRDHAGVGQFYGPLEAQQIFERFDQAELGVQPLKLEPTFYCRVCTGPASQRTCPHGPGDRLDLSGSRVREILRSGGFLPSEFTRPEIAEILREHYMGAGANSGNPRERDEPVTAGERPGVVIWLTGLSGAGKSTLAAQLRTRLEGAHRVEVLDGDEVRTHLSRGLGFSKEDRDTNIRHIGYVARLLARHRVVVIAAAISPYAGARDEVRRHAVEEGIPFVEVHVHAELQALVARDVKGLYKRALAGEIAHFTGVSDPYEAPTHADVVVRTDRESLEESVANILGALSSRGLIAGRTEEVVGTV